MVSVIFKDILDSNLVLDVEASELFLEKVLAKQNIPSEISIVDLTKAKEKVFDKLENIIPNYNYKPFTKI